MTRCAICQTLVRPEEPKAACPECAEEYHASCWTELGGCATFGCPKAPEARKPEPAAYVGGGWGDEKACPKCGRSIGASLLRCPCGARFPYADPRRGGQGHAWTDRQRDAGRARTTLLLLFLYSLTGIHAPVLGSVAGVYAWKRRALLAGADGTYLAMGFGAAALAATYVVVILLLGLGM